MIALRRAILLKANPVVSLHAHRLFSGRACSCKKDPCCCNDEHAGIWYAFKKIPGLVGCIEVVVKVLDVAADGLMTVVIGGDGTAKLEKKERKC